MTLAGLVATGLVGMVLVMAAAWATQRTTGNCGWIDAFWSFGMGALGVVFAVAPVDGVAPPTERALVIAVLVAVWSVRLGFHIVGRTVRAPEDARYAELRRNWADHAQTRLFWFCEIQAIAAVLLGLSVLVAARNSVPEWRTVDSIGAAVLALAVLGEAISDRQLARFKADPANRGTVCDIGLWSWSRHPNYFFEWMGWLAYPIFAFAPNGSVWQILSLAGPAFMYVLLAHVSGVPPLERHMVNSRGDAYRDYQRRVAAFFPRPPKPAAGGRG